MPDKTLKVSVKATNIKSYVVPGINTTRNGANGEQFNVTLQSAHAMCTCSFLPAVVFPIG